MRKSPDTASRAIPLHCVAALMGFVLFASARPAHAARSIHTDHPGQPCDLGYWAEPNPYDDMYSQQDGNADGNQDPGTFFNPGSTVTTPALYCEPTMQLEAIWYSPPYNGVGDIEANNDPANPASQPVATGDAEGLPTTWSLAATGAFMYEWPPTTVDGTPQAELFVWTLPTGDLELTFEGWCANSNATATFTWMGNEYSANCNAFTDADLLINSESGLPDGYVSYPDNQVYYGSDPDWQVTESTTTTVTLPASAQANSPFVVNVQVTTTDGQTETTGSVDLWHGSNLLGTSSINPSTGYATFNLPAMPLGTMLSLTADYQGVANETQASSGTLAITVIVPTPTINISPQTITLGQSATLTWSSSSATSCTAFNSWTGTQATSGSIQVTPTTIGSFVYSMYCLNGSLGSQNASVTLTVNTPPPAVTVTVTPSTIVAGHSASVTWSSTNATSCVADSAWSGTQATSGTLSVAPPVAGGYAYSLTCTGPGGVGNGAVALIVTPVTPPPPSAPTVSVTVSPATITVGQSATVSWSSTNATTCVADSAWSGSEATSGTLSVSPTATGGYAYSLTCTGGGGTANGAAALSVIAADPAQTSSAAPSKGGGGSVDLSELIALAGMLAWRVRRSRLAGSQAR